jgi:hypothetical protein
LKANTQSFAMELFQNLAEDKFNTLTAWYVAFLTERIMM